MSDFKITVHDIVGNGNISEKELFFLKDFLIPMISKMSSRYFENYHSEIENKSIYEDGALRNFTKFRINNCLKWHNELEGADYLDETIKSRVVEQLNRLIKDIENYIEHPFPYLQPKLKFKWNKIDVLYFFHLLRENNQIQYLTNAELGQIIDGTVEYRKGNQYLPIKDSRIRLSGFNQQTPTSVDKSKERLHKLFKNLEFYKD